MSVSQIAHQAPSADAKKRVAVIDVGSNTLRLVVFDGAPRSPAYFFNEKVYCGLGADLEQTGKLSKEGRARALSVLGRFSYLLSELDDVDVVTVATAAVRDAKDGKDFCNEVQKKTGIHVRILSGEEEGQYAARGVMLGEHRAKGVVADIGGASMELAKLSRDGDGKAITTPLGPLRLAATGYNRKQRRKYIEKTLEKAWPAKRGDVLHLVGGGWRALARLIMEEQNYPLHVLHGFEIKPDDAISAAKIITESDPVDLAAKGISKARAANAPLTAEVLEVLVRLHKPSAIIMSACGLREGLLYHSLTPKLRASDPLIKASELMEVQNARFPGQGESVYDWLSPVIGEMPDRLLRSACMLADVNWHTHPDYRASACFNTATESSLLGLNHQERMMLAVTLAHRYKGARGVIESQPGVGLLSTQQMDTASAAGKLIRLALMATSMSVDVLPKLSLNRGKSALKLSVPIEFDALVSPALEARLAAAAEALGLAPRLEQGSGV